MKRECLTALYVTALMALGCAALWGIEEALAAIAATGGYR